MSVMRGDYDNCRAHAPNASGAESRSGDLNAATGTARGAARLAALGGLVLGRLSLGGLGLGWAAGAQANTSNGYNLPPGVTELSRDMYGLHMEVFWICVGIAVVVFGAMIYSLVKFRHSKGAVPDTTMIHSTKVEIIWTIIPVVILVVMAIPAAELILKQEDSRNSELSIRVTGYQWKWEYQYLDAAEGIDFYSTLARDSNYARQLNSGIDPKSVANYLLDVDKPLVIPSGAKVRLLLTSQDVIHAWWVPDFGAKRSAIPGYVNELWFKVDPGKEGIYRGQCAALCGRDHGFMPVVVEVKTPDDFKRWVADQKAALKPPTPAEALPTTPAAPPAQAAVGTDAPPAHAVTVAGLGAPVRTAQRGELSFRFQSLEHPPRE
jgi:cytochrome c oxidase subunit 2